MRKGIVCLSFVILQLSMDGQTSVTGPQKTSFQIAAPWSAAYDDGGYRILRYHLSSSCIIINSSCIVIIHS